MREIDVGQVTQAVAELFLQANYVIPEDVMNKLQESREKEDSPLGQMVLDQILENNKIGAEENMPVCQDTGMSVVFLTIGQEVHFTGGALEDAVIAGVGMAYTHLLYTFRSPRV